MGRSPCCEKVGLKKGAWTPEEDEKLLAFIEQHGHGSWRALPVKAGLQRCGKSCRLRWTNYLRPDIKRGKFSLQEEQTIIQLHALLGNRWSAIATHLPKRTDNEIKNYWNTHLKKRLTKMGIDPVTHKLRAGSLTSSTGLSHMAQWESARLEAEARLVRESKLLASFTNSAYDDNNYKNPALRPPCLDVLKAWQAQLGAIPSSSTGSSALSAIMALGGDHLESPTSTLTFHGDQAIGTNIPILPLNDASLYEEIGGGQWYGQGGPNKNACHVDGFPDLLVGEYEGYGLKAAAIDGINAGENYVVAGGEHNHGTDEGKNYWNDMLMNLVAVNVSHSGSNNVVL